MRDSLLLILSIVTCGLLMTSKASAVDALPEWMAGDWCTHEGDEPGEEHWLPARGGLMLGTNRTVVPHDKTRFEFLRIEQVDGVATYFGQPDGVSATAFKRTDGGSEWIRFENPTHDYPRRIEYRRHGHRLHAEIGGPGKDGKALVIGTDFSRCASAEQAAESLIHSLFAAFNRHDVGAMAALYTPDAVLMSSDFTVPRHGRDGVRKTYTELFAQLPQVRDEVKTLVINGDQAAVSFVSRWSASDTTPSGQVDIATFFTFREGRIASDTTYFDVPAP
ncbi:MAG: DUF6265 family protein [Tahibacter sp.]